MTRGGKGYGLHLLREAIHDVWKLFADILHVFSIIACVIGVGLMAWGFLLDLGSFLESPLGIKPNFEEPYAGFGFLALLAGGGMALTRLLVRPKPRA